MRHYRCAAFVLAAAMSSPIAVPAAAMEERAPEAPLLTIVVSPGNPPPAAAEEWTDRVVAIPGAPAAEEKRGRVAALPTFKSSVVDGGERYPFTMVGSDPSLARARNVVVPVQIIPVRVEFPDGTVLDPTEPDSCAGGATPLALVLRSPLFRDFDYGTGPRQFIEEVRRREFWRFTGPGGINPGYSLRFSVSALASIRVVLPAGYVPLNAPCGHLAVLSSHAVDQILMQLVPQFRSFGVGPNTLPLLLFLDTLMMVSGFAPAAGFHTAVGGQTLGAAMWASAGIFATFPDIWALSRVLAGWCDDPFANNVTPPWGYRGEVTGNCSAFLEVGDPLAGQFPPIQMPDGFTYHPQETAFFSWFYGQVPSLGINGWYSSAGTFTAPAAACHWGEAVHR